jgi:poly(hydroxyalkanoate) depolymerase family esterase
MNANKEIFDMMQETTRLMFDVFGGAGLMGPYAGRPNAGRPSAGCPYFSLDASAPASDNEPLNDAGNAQFIARSYNGSAGTRDYKLYIPSGYHGQPLPLIVMLHGCKQDPDDFAEGTRMNAFAEEKQCLVAYPAQTRTANGFKCWNWYNADDQQRDQGEPAIIAGITREIIEAYHADPRRVYIAGLSAGAAMAVILGTTYPDLYAAVGVHSGLPYAGASDIESALSAMRRGTRPGDELNGFEPTCADPVTVNPRIVPTIIFHGDQDNVVHPDNGDQVMAQMQATDAIVEQGQVPDGHAFTRTVSYGNGGQPVAEQWLVHGAAHAWSGGSPEGSYTDPRGPDATHEMLRFFDTQSQLA